MTIHELRDTNEVRTLLLQALWLQRVGQVASASVNDALEWGLEIVAAGEPMPPLGFVADVGYLIFGVDESTSQRREPVDIPDWPAAEFAIYDDHVLGKLYADSSFDRATEAVARYGSRRDRVKALAYVINQLRQRAGLGGWNFSPGVIKGLQQGETDKFLAEGWESLTTDGPHPLLRESYAELIAGVRNVGSVLGSADVFELERGIAVAEFSQRIALRQVVECAERFEDSLPRQPARSIARRQQVQTRIFDEDLYPIGGFTSIANKGTIESLLHSQLAYMEPATEERPDLFDIKFLRDELLYYARDENQFFRRRRTFVLALFPDLVAARVKDRDLPAQRVILLLALVVAYIRKLIDWLSDEALLFEILFVTNEAATHLAPGEHTGDRVADTGRSPLSDERELLEILLSEQIDNGTVALSEIAAADLPDHCRDRARRSLCQCLTFSLRAREFEADEVEVINVALRDATPAVRFDERFVESLRPSFDVDEEGATPMEAWSRVVGEITAAAL